MIRISRTFAIPEREFEEKFILSSGPGGQNINKVATGVQLRFNIDKSASLTEDIKNRLREIAKSQITTEDILVIESKAFRSQSKNRKEARKRLAKLIRQALVSPKVRKKTKPTKASDEKRLSDKQMLSKKKSSRRKPNQD